MKDILKYSMIGLGCLTGLISPASHAGCVTPPAGVISWWRAENNALDLVGTNLGTLFNGTTFAPGVVGQAFSFDGVDDYIQLSNALENPFPASGFTYECWIQPNATQSGARATLISNHQVDGNWWNGISLASQFIEVTLQNGLTGGWVAWDSTAALPTNQFTHLAIVYQYSGVASNDLQVFFDGVPQVVTSTVIAGNYALGFAPGYNASDPLGLALGRTQQDSPRGYFGGKLDELTFYNRALSANEITAIFAAGSAGKCLTSSCVTPPSGLVSWWPAEGDASDIAGTNQGTLLGGVGFAPGKVGQAFSFDGVDDEISIAHTAALNFGPNDSFTVDAWLKPSPSVLGTQRSAVSLTYVCSAEAINLILLTDGKIDFGIRDNNGLSADAVSPNSILDGQWHHVVGLRDVGSHTVKLYLDGAVVSSVPDPTTGTFTRGDAQDRIGSIPVVCGGTRYFWDGEIDEVSIYKRALGTADVQAIFNAGSAGKCSAPLLQAAPAGPGLVSISWTPNTPGFVLQESLSLSSVNWTNSPSGSTNPITVPATLPLNFYRLFKP